MPARTAGGAAHTGGEKGARVSVSLHTRSRAEVLEACIHISQHMQHAQGSWSRRSIQYPSPGRARQRQSARARPRPAHAPRCACISSSLQRVRAPDVLLHGERRTVQFGRVTRKQHSKACSSRDGCVPLPRAPRALASSSSPKGASPILWARARARLRARARARDRVGVSGQRATVGVSVSASLRVRDLPPTCADDTSDHGRQPRLDRRESSSMGNRAGAERGCCALVGGARVDPRSQQRLSQQPSCVHERLDPKKPAHALGGCARLLFGPGCVRCTAPTARGSRSPAEGGKPCGGSRHSCTKPCLAAITEPPRVLLLTLVAPCIRAVVLDEQRGAGVHFFCRHTTECAGAQLGPELARRMFGGSAPRLGGSARLEALSHVTASQRVSSSR